MTLRVCPPPIPVRLYLAVILGTSELPVYQFVISPGVNRARKSATDEEYREQNLMKTRVLILKVLGV